MNASAGDFETQERKMAEPIAPELSDRELIGERTKEEIEEERQVDEAIARAGIDPALLTRKFNETFQKFNKDLSHKEDPVWAGGVRALARLAYRLKDKMAGYDTIIGDDASGRLPTLFLRELVNHKKDAEEAEHPNTYFVAGGRGDFEKRKEAIKQFLESRQPLGKSLLVTEYIQSGESFKELADLLAKMGIDFDSAAVSIINPRGYYQEMDPYGFADRLTYGSVNNEAMWSFYQKPELGGVIKGDAVLPNAVRDVNIHPRTIRGAREGMKMLAREMYPLIDEKTAEEQGAQVPA